MTIGRRLGGVLVALASLFALAGCAGTSSDPVPTSPPASSVVVPDDGARLASFGIKNGPATFSLPSGLTYSDVIDQPNVVTLVLSPTQAADALAYLDRNLAGMGFTVDGVAADAITFTGPIWSGALTFSDQVGALTLRRN